MKKLVIKKINEIIYYEKLDNGLEVYLFPKQNTHNNYVTFTTKYGSMYNAFVPLNKDQEINVPNGIAHFLEHKLFAQEKGPDPASFFESSGTNYNAHTSFKNTTYEFSGPNNLINNICFLLDYVQSPYFTEENVSQERGIIKEEINMINDNPWNMLYDKMRYNAFTKHPIRESIIGSHTDIDNINQDLLYDCYNTFYHPSNMFLVVTGNFNPEEVLKAVSENQNTKKFAKYSAIKIKNIKEPDKVFLDKEIVEINTDISKCSYSVKIPLKDINNMSKKAYLLYIHLMFYTLFGESSEFDYKCKKNGIITSSLYIESINTKDHLLISLINETNNYDRLIELIKDKLSNIVIDEQELERKKKVFISNDIFLFDNINDVNDSIIDSIIFENTLDLDTIEMINELNIKDLKSIIKEINWSNSSSVVLKKK